jgi:hypothetical protein
VLQPMFKVEALAFGLNEERTRAEGESYAQLEFQSQLVIISTLVLQVFLEKLSLEESNLVPMR